MRVTIIRLVPRRNGCGWHGAVAVAGWAEMVPVTVYARAGGRVSVHFPGLVIAGTAIALVPPRDITAAIEAALATALAATGPGTAA